MRIYSLNPISVHQQDDQMSYKQPARISPGMYFDSAQKISEVPQEKYEEMVTNMVRAEAAHQKEQEEENNLYSRNVNIEKKVELTNPNLKEIINPDQVDNREYVENGNASIYEGAGKDDEDLCYELPFNNKKLYIYNRPMHEMMKGGKIEPEENSNSVVIAAGESAEGVAFNDAQGLSFSEGVAYNDGQGVAYNDNELDKMIDGLNARGGMIPQIVGELALQLIPQIPSIISAIKSKRDQSKIGNGLLTSMQKYDTVKAVMNNLPEGKTGGYYDDLIRQFNAFKRNAKGISFNASDNTYYASGKVTEGLKKFWNFIKQKYNENKEIFAPIRDALINTANNSIQKAVTTGTTKASDYLKSKTTNTDLHKVIDTVGDAAQKITDGVKKQIGEIGKGVEPEKIYSVLN